VSTIWSDVRQATRALARRPAFASVVVLTIALGIAVNSTIFSVVDAVLIEPLPLKEPDRLVRPDVRDAQNGYLISTSIPNFKDWRRENRTLASFGMNASRTYTLTGGDRPEIVRGRTILGDYFETLGVPPARGRWITADESDRGAPAIAVVTDGFVRRRLPAGVDPIGRTIVLDAEPFTIVGVMPPSFQFPSPETEVYLPMGYFANRLCWDERGCSQGSWPVGRLKPGVDLAAAQRDLDRVWRSINEQEGRDQARPELHLLSDRMIGSSRTPLLVLMGAVAFVLLIACANVASLVLARGETRRREIAVRTALGASRGRIVATLMAEAGVLSLAGGTVGLGLTWLGVGLLRPLVADQLPSMAAARIGVNPSVAIFALGAAIASGLFFGLVPALRSASAANDDLRHGTRMAGGGRQRLRAALVVTEVALSLVLLAGAGLMIRSLRNLRQVDKGFDGRNVLTARVPLPAVRYETKANVLAFYDRLVPRLEALPGVVDVAVANSVPLSQNSWENGVIPEGLDPARPENYQSMLFSMVTPDYFHVLRIPLLRGRTFTEADRENAPPVAVVDEVLAEKFWPGEDPIGKRISFERSAESTHERPIAQYRTVIGVTKNVRHYELETASRMQVYVPLEQSGPAWSRELTVMLATRNDPRRLTEPLRREVLQLDADVPLDRVETVEGFVETALGSTRVVGDLLTLFSALAAGLAGLGLFGVLAYSVAQRSREIGVRVALGASAGQVVSLVAGQGLRLAVGGIAIGVGAAFGLTRLLQSVLFQVTPADPVTFGITAVVVVLVALAAAVVPARRAARTDPAVVLREE